MIYDRIANASCYAGGFPELAKAIAFIKKLGGTVQDGKYPIHGDRMFASVSTYQTKSDRQLPFEAHRKYIDVQVMLRGEEQIDVTQEQGLKLKDRYSQTKDILFVHRPLGCSSLILTPDTFAVFYPQDYHRPGQSISLPAEVRKLVIKIRI